MDEQASFEPRAVLAPRRAGWNRVAIAVPVMALIGAIWGGLSGPNSAATTADTHHEVTVAGPSDALQPTQASRPVAAYPSRVLGIEVRTLADLDSSSVDGDVMVAVAGWYVARPMLGCPASSGIDLPDFVAELGVDADVCSFWDRSGLLVATPNPAGSGNVGGANDHPYGLQATLAVPVVLTPGVVVPPVLSDSGTVTALVILVGRLREPGSGRELVVDRVVWAAGLGRALTTSILPKLLDQAPLLSWVPRHRLAGASFGPTGAILMETLVDLRTLAAVDPGAAAVVATASPNAQRIWYRRALGLDPARDAPRWMAIDDATGVVIATGFVGPQPRPPLPADGVNVLTTR